MEKREALVRLFLGEKTAIAQFARYCKRIALAYLKSKVASGNHYILEVNDRLDDLAWDCIADLFERDEQGKFVELETYFDKSSIRELTEAEFQMKCRRLIFSKVNDGLFRIFGNYDSSLSKIIRNIKNACSDLDLDIERIDKSNVILFGDEGPSVQVTMPPEFLEIQLSRRITGKMNIVEVMKQVQNIIIEQQLYRPQFKLVEVARVIRRTYVKNHEDKTTQVKPIRPLFLKGELQQILEEAIAQYEESFFSTYVETGKVEEGNLQAYLKATHRILSHHFIQETQIGGSYYEQLKEVMPKLTKQQYRSGHRQYLEYIVKKVRTEMLRRVKKVV